MPDSAVSNQDLAQMVLQLQAQIRDLKQDVEQKETRVARGTPSPEDRRRREPLPPSRPLDERVQEALIGRPIEASKLAKQVNDTEAAVTAVIERFEAEGRVTKLVRGGDLVQWVWRPGPNSSNEVRQRVIVGLLMAEPLGNGDLIRITQAKPKQVENDLVDIRRKEPVWWMNKGAGGHGSIYWISPDRREPPPELDGRLARRTKATRQG